METTNPLGANLMDIADNLIMENPSNPEPKAEETVEVTEDTQTEAVEDADVVEDVDDTSDIDEEVVETEEADVEDVEEEEPTVDPEPYYTVKVDGEEREVTLATTNVDGGSKVESIRVANCTAKLVDANCFNHGCIFLTVRINRCELKIDIFVHLCLKKGFFKS